MSGTQNRGYRLHQPNGSTLPVRITSSSGMHGIARDARLVQSPGARTPFLEGTLREVLQPFSITVLVRAPTALAARTARADLVQFARDATQLERMGAGSLLLTTDEEPFTTEENPPHYTVSGPPAAFRALWGTGLSVASVAPQVRSATSRDWEVTLTLRPRFARWTSVPVITQAEYDDVRQGVTGAASTTYARSGVLVPSTWDDGTLWDDGTGWTE